MKQRKHSMKGLASNDHKKKKLVHFKIILIKYSFFKYSKSLEYKVMQYVISIEFHDILAI